MIRPIALITGGATRLGAEIASFLVDKECDLLIHYHHSKESAELLAERLREDKRRIELVQADLSDANQIGQVIDALKEKFGRLDFLINNAGLFERATLGNIQTDRAEQLWQVNCQAILLMIQGCQELLEETQGSVVNLIDNCSGNRPWAYHSHYAASKAGALALTRSLAVELAPMIRINAVGPGGILCAEDDPILETNLLEKIPMQRWGAPREIAETVWFLLTGPRYITGQLIIVDGGWSLK
jgi:pteridine reductase